MKKTEGEFICIQEDLKFGIQNDCIASFIQKYNYCNIISVKPSKRNNPCIIWLILSIITIVLDDHQAMRHAKSKQNLAEVKLKK